MQEKSNSAITESDNEELHITRVFNAPRELVFKAWTEPERLAHWWGPKGFTWSAGTMDLRTGGIFHYGLKAPNGAEMWGKFVYRNIIIPELLEFIVSFCDKDGNILRHPLSETWPLEVFNNLTFIENAGKTTLILKGYPINANEEERKTFKAGHQSMQAGFKATMDQLDEYLASELKG